MHAGSLFAHANSKHRMRSNVQRLWHARKVLDLKLMVTALIAAPACSTILPAQELPLQRLSMTAGAGTPSDPSLHPTSGSVHKQRSIEAALAALCSRRCGCT